MLISSRQNPIIKETVKLKSAAARRESGLHIAEGERLLKEAAEGGLETLFALESFLGAHPWAAESAKQVFTVTEPVLEALCDTKTPQGALATVKTPPMDVPAAYPEGLGVVLENIADPGNVGTMIRTADGVGASFVLLSGCADAFSPKVVRASMGSVYHLPLYAGDAVTELLKLKDQSFTLVAGHLKGSETMPNTGKNAAIVIGSEARGISDEAAALCTLFKLRMDGKAESFNAAVAAGIMLYLLKSAM
jgi:TrmH family RNA methyltransferase